jgi:hypothetical protein
MGESRQAICAMGNERKGDRLVLPEKVKKVTKRIGKVFPSYNETHLQVALVQVTLVQVTLDVTLGEASLWCSMRSQQI